MSLRLYPGLADAALLEDYGRAGFGASLGCGSRPALLMVDFAVAYFDHASPLYADVASVVEPAQKLLEAARGAHRSCVFSQVVFEPGGGNGGLFYKKIPALRALDADCIGSEILPSLAPLPGEAVFTKQCPSAFFGTDLAQTLRGDGVDTVVIAGLTTSGCVRATAIDALQHGFVPLVVADAVGDRREERHLSNLFDLSAKYADVVSVADGIRCLTRLRARS